MRDWLVRQWHDIAGNFKFWLLGLIAVLIVTFAKKLLKGSEPWQQMILIAVFVILFIWAAVATWQASQPSGGSKKLYGGETKLRLFYPGSGRQPRAVGQTNIFRWLPVRVGGKPEGAKPSDPEVAVLWIVFVVFDEDVDPSAWTFVLSSDVNPKLSWRLEDFGPRSVCFTINEELPAGVLECFWKGHRLLPIIHELRS